MIKAVISIDSVFIFVMIRRIQFLLLCINRDYFGIFIEVTLLIQVVDLYTSSSKDKIYVHFE